MKAEYSKQTQTIPTINTVKKKLTAGGAHQEMHVRRKLSYGQHILRCLSEGWGGTYPEDE